MALILLIFLSTSYSQSFNNKTYNICENTGGGFYDVPSGVNTITDSCDLIRLSIGEESKLVLSQGVSVNVIESVVVSKTGELTLKDNSSLTTENNTTVDFYDNSSATMNEESLINATTLNFKGRASLILTENSSIILQDAFNAFVLSNIVMTGKSFIDTNSFLVYDKVSLTLRNESYIKTVINPKFRGGVVWFRDSSKIEYTLSTRDLNIYGDSLFCMTDDASIEAAGSVTVAESCEVRLMGRVKVNIASSFNINVNANAFLNESVAVTTKSFNLNNFAVVEIAGSVTIKVINNFKVAGQAFYTLKDHALMTMKNINLNGGAMNMYDDTTMTATTVLSMTNYMSLNLFNTSVITCGGVSFLQNQRTALFAQTKLSSTSSAQNIVSGGVVTLYNESIFETKKTLQMNGNGSIELYDESRLNVNTNIKMIDQSQLSSYGESTVITINITMSGDALLKVCGKSKTEPSGLVTLGENSMIVIEDNGLFAIKDIVMENGTTLVLKSENNMNCATFETFNAVGGNVEINGNSFIKGKTLKSSFNIIDLKKRVIGAFPLFIVDTIEHIEIGEVKGDTLDLVSSPNPITIDPLPNGTFLLQERRLLRYGNASDPTNVVYCHMKVNEVADASYIEPHCPCTGIHCVAVPDQTLGSVIINIDEIVIGMQRVGAGITFGEMVRNSTILFKDALMILHGKNSLPTKLATSIEFSIDEETYRVDGSGVEFIEYIVNNEVNPKTVSVISSTIPLVFMSKNGYIVGNKVYEYLYYNPTNNTLNTIHETDPICEDGFIKIDKKCVSDENCKQANGEWCVKCYDGYVGGKNKKCYIPDDHCQIVAMNLCSLCSPNSSYVNVGGTCTEISDYSLKDDVHIISCQPKFYLDEGTCKSCLTKYLNCDLCDSVKCFRCSSTYELSSDNTCVKSQCGTVGYEMDENGKCYKLSGKCGTSVNGVCMKCETGEILDNTRECVTSKDTLCEQSSSNGCHKCISGYFSNSILQCDKCDETCASCYNKTTQCTSCPENRFLNTKNHTCDTNDTFYYSCDKISVDGQFCVRCKSGFYKTGTTCLQCKESCGTCLDGNSCLTCGPLYFMTIVGECLLKSSVEGCQKEVTSDGCSACVDGYYIYQGNQCKKCNTTCSTCEDDEMCTSCKDGYIIENNECVNYQIVDKCVEARDSKCTKCTFWHRPVSYGQYCEAHVVWWVVLLIILFFILLVFSIITLIIYILRVLTDRKRRKIQEKNTSIFRIDKSNVEFKNIGGGFIIDHTILDYNDENEEIPVGVETKMLVCVGNVTEPLVKMQFTTKNVPEKYSIRVVPDLVVLKKGEGCEFNICITPLCMCYVDDIMLLHVENIHSGKGRSVEIGLEASTGISSRLNPEELLRNTKIGEGSFGVVYSGEFRGNKVAIKVMKEGNNTEEAMNEFEHEVEMLDKFRSDYIIHFYGAVFIPTKTCLVTEFAEHGSLYSLIKTKKVHKIELRVRFLIDAGRGIEYLHNNGILHRDIKPDNILIFSYDLKENVLAKLTDFGSSRNINMLMTNMTFTKGIGTPVYMAPEILNQEHYKKEADVYSFGVTMFECLSWRTAFPKSEYPFSWKIAETIISGKRPERTPNVPQKYYDIITHTWAQTPSERFTIQEVIKQLVTA
ncbi:protein serine/threonine kinase, putative [Entamoeba invadens IP1]|uniref:Protein serine/threonine kinase, putative n=1 Tax=Entamoeba invadens IP1 TaxID=370355 RepID=L7FLY8_ENTIV|nr:protein serine/threonine kinase, putative [Entamoeba invadens IP1]ELP84873.1 protein serine/threonine kinase, putative [Entamoeba invadens IP1]|eukprot:XP_004184219.1 protein serine/threonine kinase, putative [Entamoeba invadens IP1]